MCIQIEEAESQSADQIKSRIGDIIGIMVRDEEENINRRGINGEWYLHLSIEHYSLHSANYLCVFYNNFKIPNRKLNNIQVNIII